MNIGFYRWKDTDADTKAKIMARSGTDIEDVLEKVKPIIERVRKDGDSALINYARQFDNAEINTLKVSEEEFEEASKTLDPDLKAGIDHCIQNVKRFHAEQMRRVEKHWMFEVEPGVWAGEKVTPISSVGLYVPGGKNLYPSAMFMLCIPAVIADVPQISVMTPPQKDGKIGNALLYAAQISGVKNVYKAGGAQAIAALAYGTETIPLTKKVLGPGSPYVAAAKQILSSIIDPGMPAGPSESIILCDETANPDNTILDLLNEAEHGPDSAALLITHSEKLANYICEKLPDYIQDLPEPQKNYVQSVLSNYGGIILTDSLEESIALANDYAVEHLFLKTANAEKISEKLINCGEIIFGENNTISLCNYGVGVNHVLPTNGKAHSYSCTSIWDFLKRTSLAKVDKQGFESLKDSVTALCDYEGFPAHGNSIRKRKTQ